MSHVPFFIGIIFNHLRPLFFLYLTIFISSRMSLIFSATQSIWNLIKATRVALCVLLGFSGTAVIGKKIRFTALTHIIVAFQRRGSLMLWWAALGVRIWSCKKHKGKLKLVFLLCYSNSTFLFSPTWCFTRFKTSQRLQNTN